LIPTDSISLCRISKDKEGGEEERKVGEAKEIKTNKDHTISTKG
jgi:hypothetical protein